MLVLALVGVALLGIAGLASATVVSSESDVHALVSRRQLALDRATVAMIAALRGHASSWQAFPLGPVLNLADEAGVALRIRDSAGIWSVPRRTSPASARAASPGSRWSWTGTQSVT